MRNLLLLLVLLVPVQLVETTTVTVSTPVGEIIGIEEQVDVTTTLRYRVQKFRGIPYAESPTGNLRFMKPVPKSNFNTAFDATREGPICFQLAHPLNTIYSQSEDCLRLNIYVPVTDQNSTGALRPVMVWIHGGGFVSGHANSFDGSKLSTFGEVIVVTMNYRLNFLGFYTGSDNLQHENFGLWDQHLAIKWVNVNIQGFGGDPGKVTLFGGSAGASSVIYQSFYPGNMGLFHHVIAQSGTINSPWGYQDLFINAEFSYLFAAKANCTTDTNLNVTECLRTRPTSVIQEAIVALYEGTPGPVIDGNFILDHPESLVNMTMATDALEMFHSVDLMIGYNSFDGSLDLHQWVALTRSGSVANLTISKEIYLNELIPHYLQCYYKMEPSLVSQMVTHYEYSYLQDQDNDFQRFLKLADLATDYYVAVPAVQTALRHTKQNSAGTGTYAYEFASQPVLDYTPSPLLQDPTMMKHGQEISYVFGEKVYEACSRENLQQQCMTYLATLTLWSNFAKNGNPNSPMNVTPFIGREWPQFSTDWEYLRITSDIASNSTDNCIRKYMRLRPFYLWTQTLSSIMRYEYMTYIENIEIE